MVKPNLLFYLLPEYWGKGYASESGKAVLAYGYEQLKLKEIMGMVIIGNEASEKVLLKLGFVESKASPIEDGTVKLFEHVR